MPSSFSLGRQSVLEIRGNVDVGCGAVFRITGHFVLSNHSFFGSKCIVACSKEILIGELSRIAFGSVVMDTNLHFVVFGNQVRRKEGVIKIGDRCWIGNNSTISKGCLLPNHTIVAARSYVAKDYTEAGENCFLVGSPAKVKSNGIRRLYNLELEKTIQAYFNTHNEAEFYLLSEEEQKEVSFLTNNI